MAAPDMDVIKEVPGYKVILKAVLKSQIQQLVEQLAASTDEESVILTASVSDGTLSHLGSDSGKNFLEDHEDIKSQFLGFCLKRHHIKKQEKEREKQQQREAQARAAPVTPPRYAGMGGPQGGTYMPQRSPRFNAPHQQGPPHPVALRVTTGGPMRGPASGPRHEPYPTQRPERRGSSGSYDQTHVPNPKQQPLPQLQKMPSGPNGQVIKVEDDDAEQSNQSAPGVTSRDNSEPVSPAVKTSLRSDIYDDSKSSVSVLNESDLKQDISIPAGGLSLDSDLSSLISPTTATSSTLTTNDSVQEGHTSAILGDSEDPNVSVKLETVDEGDMDLEITGVELGQALGQAPGGDPMGSQDWGQGMQGGAAGGPGDMAGYIGVYKPTQLRLSKSYLNMMSNKRKRNTLSLADKYEVIKLLDQKMHQTQIAKKMGCSQSHVSCISTYRADIMAGYEAIANATRERHQSGKAADVKAVSGPVLQEKACALAKTLDKPEFKPSTGWLNFVSRW